MSDTRTGGAVFKNRRKEQDTHPDWRGDITTPDGKKWEISMWERVTRNGDAYYSVGMREFREPPPRQEPRREAPAQKQDAPDEIPF